MTDYIATLTADLDARLARLTEERRAARAALAATVTAAVDRGEYNAAAQLIRDIEQLDHDIESQQMVRDTVQAPGMTETLDDVVSALDGQLRTSRSERILRVWLDDEHQTCAMVARDEPGFSWACYELDDGLTRFGDDGWAPTAAETASQLTAYAGR